MNRYYKLPINGLQNGYNCENFEDKYELPAFYFIIKSSCISFSGNAPFLF